MDPMTEAPVTRRRRRRRGNRRRRPLLLGAAAVGLMLAGIIGFGVGTEFDGPTSSGTAAESRSGVAQASEAASPDRPTPSHTPTASDEASGIRATRITIERLGIDLPIVPGDGIDAPMHQAAHYPGSAWPGGATNNIYIYGHAQEGMFLSLWEAKPGDEVKLALVDGTERIYVVTEVLPEVPWDALEYTQPTPTEQLTLQTSTSDTMTAPRFVVIAVPKT